MRFGAACLQLAVTVFISSLVLSAGSMTTNAQTMYDLLFGSPKPTKKAAKPAPKKTTKHKSANRVRKKNSSRSGLGAGTGLSNLRPDPPTRKESPIIHQAANKSAENVEPAVITLLAGEPGQSSLHMAHDLSVVVGRHSPLRVMPVVGTGGLQNVKDLLSNSRIDLAITYGDVLAEISKNEELKKTIGDKVRTVAKLCNAEVHILAGSKISDISELQGKPVNFGPEGSASQFAAKKIFQLLQIAPAVKALHTRDAVAMVKTGELAATVILAGKPAAHLAGISRADGLKILAVPYLAGTPDHYLPSRITAADYPLLIGRAEAGIDTLAVGEILIAHTPNKKKTQTKEVAAFIRTFFQNLEQLRVPPRHPKWHETTLSAPVPGWTRLAVAAEILSELKLTGTTASKAIVVNRSSKKPTEQASTKTTTADPQQVLLDELTKINPSTQRQEP